ncbi:MAG: hypothetical protein QXQ94_11060 [Candidatus Bathyarchaeia archaeon]
MLRYAARIVWTAIRAMAKPITPINIPRIINPVTSETMPINPAAKTFRLFPFSIRFAFIVAVLGEA